MADRSDKACGCCCLLIVLVVAGNFVLPIITSLFEPQVPDFLIDTFSTVCDGQGVPDAAEYIPGPGLHPIILLDPTGQRHTWTNSIPEGWRSENVSDTELVVLVSYQIDVAIEVVHYAGPDITRYQYHVDVVLRAAKTGEIIESITIYGTEPRECRQTEDYDLTELHGDEVPFSDLSDWLEPYVSG